MARLVPSRHGGRRVTALAALTLLASLAISSVAQAQGSRIAGTDDTYPSFSGLYASPAACCFGQSLGAVVVPERSGTPTRLEVLIANGFIGGASSSPVRIALHSTGSDGKPGAILASTNVPPSAIGPAHSVYNEVAVSGWPRMEAGQTYVLSAVVSQFSSGGWSWQAASTTPTVPRWWSGRIAFGASEPEWTHTGTSSVAYGLRIFAPRPTRITAHGLAADRSPLRANLTPSATLHALEPQEPLGGKQVRFYSGNTLLCTATTAANGRAACNVPLPMVNGLRSAGNYRAYFAGDDDYEASSDQGTLVE